MSIELQERLADTTSRRDTAAFGLGWAIRRAILGLVILTVGVGSLAWLTHASIDPAPDATSQLVTSDR